MQTSNSGLIMLITQEINKLSNKIKITDNITILSYGVLDEDLRIAHF